MDINLFFLGFDTDHRIQDMNHRILVTMTISKLDGYFWPKLRRDTTRFVERCHFCQLAQGHSQNIGLYTPLPIPNLPWQGVSPDFVVGLPYQGYDSILMVVDIFLKMAHFIPYRNTLDASHTNSLFFSEVVRLNAVPKSLTSDQDTWFMGHFGGTWVLIYNTALHATLKRWPN